MNRDDNMGAHPARWVVRRGAFIERWRVEIHLKVYYGFGQPRFQFDFRFGFPKRVEQPEWIAYEGALEIEDGYGI